MIMLNERLNIVKKNLLFNNLFEKFWGWILKLEFCQTIWTEDRGLRERPKRPPLTTTVLNRYTSSNDKHSQTDARQPRPAP